MIRLIAIGDSLVFGKGVEKKHSWVSILQIEFDLIDKYNYQVFNLGIPGDDSGKLSKRIIDEVGNRLNDTDDNVHIFILIGVNDCKGIGNKDNFCTSKETFNSNLNQIIDSLKKYTDNINFISILPVDEIKTRTIQGLFFRNDNIELYNSYIQAMCLKKGVNYIDIFSTWMKQNYQNYYAEDGIHLNVDGNKKVYSDLKHQILNAW
ncbi:hypothetical protein COT97_04685 [Candidatus Falkowbacteria bacterium CG10_big_fil_rev_8_21_14_0_10_39_11]|uniref:SGNH hydrolase-type esterase domain-containing protein n=1 Tax=Candidatus Falkowbacteria bacterium CG10_big_fil_rev_8_21_14_0_10_39_11 TaxID=1974565 RepID=A0A2H0V421_9BACT|nr:MAG: hypothetical protein COT97_04685 [Candidatus Falkowbacteria bacterium CG10_big_fil_rev_8_21_14_0_10_39_11]